MIMKLPSVFLSVVCVGLLVSSASAKPGEAPKDSGILFEAEDCKPLDGKFWRVLRYKQSDGLTAYPSGGGVLEAAALGVAPASGKIGRAHV